MFLYSSSFSFFLFFFFFNDTATTEIYTLSLHDALPILRSRQLKRQPPDQRKGETTRLFDRRLKHGSPARLALTVVLAHGELLRQQLVEFHAPPGRQRAAAESLLIRSGAGMMQGVDGLEKTAQAEPLRHFFRQRVIE